MKTCRTCGSPLIRKETKRTAEQLKKQYYYTAYDYCQSCKKMYLNDQFKVINKNYDLFTKRLSPLLAVDVEIWTDGACVFNGTEKAKAAWAFVSGTFESRGFVEGKQTNNTAEAYAIYHALLWAARKGYKHIRVHSDSQITLNNLVKPVEMVKENRVIFERVADLIKGNALEVSYQKVVGHAGDENNERADKLANSLVGIK